MKTLLSRGILAALLLGSSTVLTAQTTDKTPVQTLDVDRTKYPDYSDKTNPDRSLMTPAGGQAAPAMGRAATRSGRPDHVNNAETRYFPPVFNQDGGSCGSASRICYMFSYELAAWRDLDASKPENYYPSHFVWLHTNSNGTITDQGKDAFVQHVGVPSAATYGGQTYSSTFGYQEESNDDFGWMQGYDKWFEAMHNRMLKPSNFPVNVGTEEGREAVKNWLWNHNGDDSFHAGGICGIGVASGGVWEDIPRTATNDRIGVTGMGYVAEWGRQVDHALTIVGYDDRIEFDLDKDGIYGEAEADELGAWIIVNSWGNWENGGFIYCPYAHGVPAFNQDGTVPTNFWTPEIYRVRKDYRPLRTIKLLMDYSRRSEIALSAGISADLNATAPEKTVPFVHFTYAGDGKWGNTNPAPEVPMLGRWADGKLHDEPMEFGYDLTDLTDGYDMSRPLKYFFIIDSRTWAEGEGTIHGASIMDYRYDELGVETPFATGEGVEIKNRGGQTVITVTVQGSSYYPPQNAAYDGTTLTWQAPLRSAATVEAYRIYNGTGSLVAELDATATTYATPATGGYGVSAVYADGNESGTATVTAPETLSAPNTGISLSQAGFTIPGVFGTKYRQATIEYRIKPTTLRDWNQSGGPGWEGGFMFHANADGRFTAGWSTQDRIFTGTPLKVGQWTHVAIVVDGGKMTVYLDGENRGSVSTYFYSGIGGFGDLVFSSNGAQNAQDAQYDEIRVWNTARTAEQVKACMNAEFTGNLMPQGLIAYLKGDLITLDDGSRALRDCAGGHHATLQGSYTPVSSGMPTPEAPDAYPSVTIDDPEGTIHAGIPVTLTATYNDAVTRLQWTAGGAGAKDLAVAGPTLTFEQAGTHTVSVTATGAGGVSTTDERTLIVEAAPAPDATFTMTATGSVPAGERVTLHATAPRTGYLYRWSMPGADNPTATSPTTATQWQAQGTYKVTLTVTSPDGTKDTHTATIDVIEVAPQAALSVSPAVVLRGETATLHDESLYTPLTRRWHLTNGTADYIVYADASTVTIDRPGVYDITLDVANNAGKSTATRERALIVTNADSENGLNFSRDDATVTTTQTPLATGQKAFTIDWWMNPAWPEDNLCGIGDSEETLLLKTMGGGKMQLCMAGAYATTSDSYVIPGEWHHYGVTFDSGKARFYRDGVLIITRPVGSTTAVPAMEAFRIGGTAAPFKGSIDELRVWAAALTEAQLRSYANEPIADVPGAEADNKLVLYYNFNRSGGDVKDATSNANHGVRTAFGPDGDAWGLSKGVFCLNLDEGSMEDITAQYLTNYRKPFADDGTCVNGNLATRTFAITKWTTAATAYDGSITTGAHVDRGKDACFTVTTAWDGFADKITDHTVYQTVTLPAGYYTFTAQYDDTYEGQCGGTCLVAAKGNTLPVTDNLSQALAYTAMKGKSTAKENHVSFLLSEETTVSLGLLVNMSGQNCMTLQQFALTQSEVTITGTTEEIPAAITYNTHDTDTPDNAPKGIYDLTGRLLRTDSRNTQGLAPGLYIVDGVKRVRN